MKSVMVFDPHDTQAETLRKWQAWNEHKCSVEGKYIEVKKMRLQQLRGKETLRNC